MADSYSENPGSFVPTSYIWDVAQLGAIEVTSPEFKELLVRLYQNINNIALVLNTKDSGYYVQEEFVNGQIFYPNPALSSATAQTATYRQVFRKVISFGGLPDTATAQVAHGITVDANTTFTRIYATATNPGTKSIPIPFASSTAGDIISIDVDATNINITTASNKTAYTVCYVVVEFLKQ